MAEEGAREGGALDDPRAQAVVDQIGRQVVAMVRSEVAALTAAARESSVALERRLHEVEESLAAEVERVRSSAKPVIDLLGGELRSMVADTRNLAAATHEVGDRLTEVVAVARSAADAAAAASGLQEQLETISRSLGDRQDVDLAPLHDRIDQLARSLAAAQSVDLTPVLDAVAASRPDLTSLDARLDDLARQIDEHGVDLTPVLDAVSANQPDLSPVHARIDDLARQIDEHGVDLTPVLDAVSANQPDLSPVHARIDDLARQIDEHGVDLTPVLDAVSANQPDLSPVHARIDDLARQIDEHGVDLGPLHSHLDALSTRQADQAAELRDVVSDRSLSTAARLDAVAAAVAQVAESVATASAAQQDQPDVGDLVNRLANRIDDAAQLARNDQQSLAERLAPLAEQVQALGADAASRHAVEAVAASIDELRQDRHALAGALGSLTERLESVVVEGQGAVFERLDAIDARAPDAGAMLDALVAVREAARPLEQIEYLAAAVRELGQREPDISGDLAPILQALERVQEGGDRTAGRVDELADVTGTLRSLGPAIESALAALSTDVSGLVANDDAIRSALLRLHEESASTSTRLEEIAGAAFAVRSIGPDLHAGLAGIKAQVDELTARDEDARTELAAVGPKLNELLERRPDWNQVLEPLAERLERHTGTVSQNHELLERVLALIVAMRDTVGLTAGIGDQVRDALAPLIDTQESSREDLGSAVESLARLTTSSEEQRDAVAALTARYDEGLEAIRLAVATPVGNLERLIALRADHTDSGIEALRPALASLEAMQDQLTQLDGMTASFDRLHQRVEPLHDRVDAIATAVEGIDVSGPVADAAAELAEQMGARTAATAAGLARMLDDRLGAMGERIDERLAATVGSVAELGPTIREQLDAVQATVAGANVGDVAAAIDALGVDLAAQRNRLDASIQEHLDPLEGRLGELRAALDGQSERTAELVSANLAELRSAIADVERSIGDQSEQATAFAEPLEALRRELTELSERTHARLAEQHEQTAALVGEIQRPLEALASAPPLSESFDALRLELAALGERTEARLAEQDEQTAALIAQLQRPLDVLTRTAPVTEPLAAIQRAVAELADRTGGQLAQLAQTLDAMDQSLTEESGPDLAAPLEALQQVLLGGLGDIRAAVRSIDDELASRLEVADASLATRLTELQTAVTAIERALTHDGQRTTDDVAAEVAGVRDAISATERSLDESMAARLDALTASVTAAQQAGAARAVQSGELAADAVAELREELASIDRTVSEQISVLRAAISQSQQGIADHVGAQLTSLRTTIGDQSAADPARVRAELDRALDQLGGEVMAAVNGLRAQIERGANDAGDLRTNLDVALERVASRLQSDVGKIMAAVSGSDELLQDRLRRVDSELTDLRGTMESLVRRTGDTLPVLASAEPPAQGAQMGGFEAGAVLGASQAAWVRLEQRLDHDFDELSREVQQLRNSLDLAVRALEALGVEAPVTAAATGRSRRRS